MMKMVKQLFIVGALLLSMNLQAQSERKKITASEGPVLIYGQIVKEGKLQDGKISVCLFDEYVYGKNKTNYKKFVFKLDSKGRFNMKLPPIDNIRRLNLWITYPDNNEVVINTILNMQVVEPNDHIYFSYNLDNTDSSGIVPVSFSGTGAARYNCWRELAAIDPTGLFSIEGPLNVIHTMDSLLLIKTEILNRYRAKLSNDAAELLDADYAGKLYRVVLQGINSSNEVNRQKWVDGEVLNKLYSMATTQSQQIQALSPNYVEFLHAKAKIELIQLHKGKNFKFKELYNKLKQDHSGVLRDIVLTYALYNQLDMFNFFFGCDPDDFDFCLKDATALIKTPFLKNAMKKKLESNGVGASALDFSLAADTSGRLISLKDLKGKVVLIDMWAYTCTGCYMFAGRFHKDIYPKFKDNPDFQVVSVFLDETSGKDDYLRRLRGEGGYTFKEYTNLYAGKGEVQGDSILQHYGVSSMPFLLLIDKEGKIVSSTLPFFGPQGHDKEVEQLTTLITKTLAR